MVKDHTPFPLTEDNFIVSLIVTVSSDRLLDINPGELIGHWNEMQTDEQET